MGKEIIEKLKSDFKESMLGKDKIKKDLVQMLRSNIQNYIRDNQLTESTIKKEEVVDIIAKEMKQQKDSLEAFERGGRKDLVEVTNIRISILENYLPKQLSVEEIKTVVLDTMGELEIDIIDKGNRGILMKNLMPKLKGIADGKMVNEIVNSL